MGHCKRQQVVAQVSRGGAQRDHGQVHVTLQHVAQQVFFTPVVTVERLLGTTGAFGHRVHAQPHSALGKQGVHGSMDAAIAVRTPGGMGGRDVMGVDYTVQFSF